MPKRKRLAPVFVDENGDPIQFYVHESVEHDNRDKVTGLIEVVESLLRHVIASDQPIYSRDMEESSLTRTKAPTP